MSIDDDGVLAKLHLVFSEVDLSRGPHIVGNNILYRLTDGWMDGWMGGLMIGYTGHHITEKNPMANLGRAWNFEDL